MLPRFNLLNVFQIIERMRWHDNRLFFVKIDIKQAFYNIPLHRLSTDLGRDEVSVPRSTIWNVGFPVHLPDVLGKVLQELRHVGSRPHGRYNPGRHRSGQIKIRHRRAQSESISDQMAILSQVCLLPKRQHRVSWREMVLARHPTHATSNKND